MKHAAMPRASAHPIPSSGPITNSAVDSASATKALSCQTVTAPDRLTGRPRRGSMMCPIRAPFSQKQVPFRTAAGGKRTRREGQIENGQVAPRRMCNAHRPPRRWTLRPKPPSVRRNR